MKLKNHQIEEFNDDEIKHQFLEESKFTVLFPAQRKQYIKETERFIRKAIESKKISLDIDYDENTITVKTNTSTRDPFIIIKGRDFITLISRNVPLAEAIKVLDDKYTCEIIKISGLCKTQDVFINRRSRLEGPNGKTMQAIMLLTKTYVQVQGKTVCVIGEYNRVQEVVDIVEGCFKNLHPIHQIKRLMVKRELEKDSKIKNDDWKRFLPEVKSKLKNTRGKKRKKDDNEDKKNIESEENDKDLNEMCEKITKKAKKVGKDEKIVSPDKLETNKDVKIKKISKEEKLKKKKEKFEPPEE